MMRDYVIITDSTVDLPKEYVTETLGVPYIPLSYVMDGETYEDMSGLSGKEFFDRIRAGSMPTTSQITPEQARENIEHFGVDHTMFGTDFPMWSPKKELERFFALGYGEEDNAQMLYGNFARLFKLED